MTDQEKQAILDEYIHYSRQLKTFKDIRIRLKYYSEVVDTFLDQVESSQYIVFINKNEDYPEFAKGLKIGEVKKIVADPPSKKKVITWIKENIVESDKVKLLDIISRWAAVYEHVGISYDRYWLMSMYADNLLEYMLDAEVQNEILVPLLDKIKETREKLLEALGDKAIIPAIGDKRVTLANCVGTTSRAKSDINQPLEGI